MNCSGLAPRTGWTATARVVEASATTTMRLRFVELSSAGCPHRLNRRAGRGSMPCPIRVLGPSAWSSAAERAQRVLDPRKQSRHRHLEAERKLPISDDLSHAYVALAPMLHQGAPPLCVSLLSSGREKSVSGSLESVHFVTASRLPGRWLGNAGLALGLQSGVQSHLSVAIVPGPWCNIGASRPAFEAPRRAG